MAETWYLKLLGFPELRRPDGRLVKLKVRKHLALLAYLVVDERERYHRDQLAEFLWPQVPDENGRHSLSMAFSVLRGIFGAETIRGNHAEIEFARPPLSLDLDRLERGDVLGSETEPPLEVDGFLRGFEIEDAPGFQHWCDRRNAQLLPLLQAGILTLIDQARRSGNLQRMLTLADRLLMLDPLSEEGVRARMEVFAMQGDRVSALRVFEDWKRQLGDELGAQPSELLEGIAARLRRRQLAPMVVAEGGPALAIEPWSERFVGREAEFQVLFEAWEATTQLNTRHVLISGESGIGKSTLAMRFAASAALEGAVVARVQCFELEQRIAFGMIGALVTSLLEHPAVAGTAPESLAEVARMVPRIRERFPHLPAARPLEGEAARLHFAEGTFALFDAVMEDQPLLLIVDDYPRSDEASLSVLHLLLRRKGYDRLMVVLSARPPEPDEPAQATRIRQGIGHLPLRKLELAPLSETESEALLEALVARSGQAPGSPERRALLRTAGGNPMTLELLTRDWLTHGEAALAVSVPAMRADVPGFASEAVGYDRLIERMVPGLTPRTRMALFLAAILGPRLNDFDCFAAVGLKPPQTIAALTELVESRVLRNTERGLEFINELIRARLYLKIPIPARVRLHHSVAERLLGAVARGENLPNLEVAWHCIRANRREEATPFLMRGARDAITHGAPDEAARALSSALGHLRGRAKAEAALLLAETYQEMADWKAALECIEKLDSTQRDDPEVREMAEILEIESSRQLGEYAPEDLPDICKDLVTRVQMSREIPTRIKAALLAATLSQFLGITDFGDEIRQGLDAITFDSLDKLHQSKVLLAKAMTYYVSRQGDRGLGQVSSASALLSEVGATDSTYVLIEMGLGAIACAAGDYLEAVPHFEKSYRGASRLDNTMYMIRAAGNLTLCYLRLGCAHENRKWAETSWSLSKRIRRGSYDRLMATAFLGLTAAELGERKLARKTLPSLEEEGNAAERPWIRQAALLFKADIALLLGEEETAYGAVRAAREVSDEALAIGFSGRFARWSTLLLVREGRYSQAWKELRSYYKRIDMLDLIDRAEVLGSLGIVSRRIPLPLKGLSCEIRTVLSRLPVPCCHQLKGLGLVLPH